MDLVNETAAYKACRLVLRPLASMLLRCGMTWKQFSDLSKLMFVEAATQEFGIRGRPTNVSRVSLLTGISRKEVKRQQALMHDRQSIGSKTTDATRVLSGWFQDPGFQDANGKPRLLDESGAEPSFESLCAKYAGSVAVPTMLKELLKTETIARDPDGRLRAVRRYYKPALHDDENLLWAANLIRDLELTMNNNVFNSGDEPLRFGRKAENVFMAADAVPRFSQMLRQRGQAFLEDIDDWLTDNEIDETGSADQTVRLGVGVFAFQEEN